MTNKISVKRGCTVNVEQFFKLLLVSAKYFLPHKQVYFLLYHDDANSFLHLRNNILCFFTLLNYSLKPTS
jgi:hypothetical protein